MKIVKQIALGIIVAGLIGCSVGASDHVMKGKVAPLVQLYAIDGQQFTLDEYQGKPVVLLFWSQWCKRSRSFIADLRDGAEALKSKGVVVLAVDIDKQERFGALQAMINEEELGSFTHAFSGNDVYDQAFNAFKVNEVPTVFILDSAHRIVSHGTSFDVVAEHYSLNN